MALVFTGLATGAKVMQLFAAICIIFQPVATAREIIENCQELARCIKMIFMEINRIIDFFLDLFPDLQRLQRVHAGREQRRPTSSSTSSRIFKNYTLAEIKDYTNNFDLALLIGQGVAGKVYKGKLHDGREVAVKRLQDGLRRAQDTFGMELALIQPLGHDHIVRLVGSCAEGEERILVYEHMENGTLRDHLTNNEASPSWITRVLVLLGAARGIRHLHRKEIIHGNLTSSNILLDRSFTPRVSGFGAAVRRAPGAVSQAVDVVQTEGYQDPEYPDSGHVRPETDVYSFGVVMLEVLTGKPPVVDTNTMLVPWAQSSIRAGKLGDVLDRRPAANPSRSQLRALQLVAETAVSCLCLDGDNRLPVAVVVRKLERALDVICNAE
jgi:serine/threonine protein kinase